MLTGAAVGWTLALCWRNWLELRKIRRSIDAELERSHELAARAARLNGGGGR
jgi:hypothetical protein